MNDAACCQLASATMPRQPAGVAPAPIRRPCLPSLYTQGSYSRPVPASTRTDTPSQTQHTEDTVPSLPCPPPQPAPVLPRSLKTTLDALDPACFAPARGRIPISGYPPRVPPSATMGAEIDLDGVRDTFARCMAALLASDPSMDMLSEGLIHGLIIMLIISITSVQTDAAFYALRQLLPTRNLAYSRKVRITLREMKEHVSVTCGFGSIEVRTPPPLRGRPNPPTEPRPVPRPVPRTPPPLRRRPNPPTEPRPVPEGLSLGQRLGQCLGLSLGQCLGQCLI